MTLPGRLRERPEDRLASPVQVVDLLALAPGLPHSVRALDSADMLLTVHRLPGEAGAV